MPSSNSLSEGGIKITFIFQFSREDAQEVSLLHGLFYRHGICFQILSPISFLFAHQFYQGCPRGLQPNGFYQQHLILTLLPLFVLPTFFIISFHSHIIYELPATPFKVKYTTSYKFFNMETLD